MVDPNGMDSTSAVDDWVQLGKAVGERLFGGSEASEPSELVLTGEDPNAYLDQPTTVADSDDSSPPAPGVGAELYRQDAAAQGGSDSLGADLMRGLFPSVPALMGPIKGPEGLPQGLAQLQAGANQEVASKGGNSAVLIGEIGAAWINLQTFVAEAALGVGTAALRTSAIRSVPEVATEGAAQQAAKQGATTVAEGAAQRLTVTFGRDPNQVSHAFRHVDKMGLVRAEVQAAIERHLPTVVENIPKGRPLNQIIEVAGKRIQYSAFRLPDGSINIGRIHGVP